jgi:hypothetical protein
VASKGTQTTLFEGGDPAHIALLPNTLRPAPQPAPSSGGGISIYTK